MALRIQDTYRGRSVIPGGCALNPSMPRIPRTTKKAKAPRRLTARFHGQRQRAIDIGQPGTPAERVHAVAELCAARRRSLSTPPPRTGGRFFAGDSTGAGAGVGVGAGAGEGAAASTGAPVVSKSGSQSDRIRPSVGTDGPSTHHLGTVHVRLGASAGRYALCNLRPVVCPPWECCAVLCNAWWLCWRCEVVWAARLLGTQPHGGHVSVASSS